MRTDKREILILFLAAFLISISPLLVRWYVFGMQGIIGTTPYYHQRISDYMIKGTFDWYDPLSFGGRPYTYMPLFSFMLAGFGILGMEWGGAIMMGLMGGLGAVLCLLLAQELIGRKKVFVVILLSSPGFIYLFSHLSTRTPPILLGLLAIYLTLNKKPWWWTSVPLALSFVFHLETGLIFSFLIFFVNKEHISHLKSILPALLAAGVFYAPYYLAYGIPQINAIHADYVARGYGLEALNLPLFSWETGQNYDNVALLVLLFSFAGLYYTKNRFLKIWFLFSIVLGIASARFILYMAFPAAILAVSGIYQISVKNKKYRKPLLVGFALYSIAIGSWMAVAFGTSYPITKQYDAFAWIRDNTPENVTVLSDWAHGHWVTGIAYRKSFVDGYAEYAPEADKRMAELKEFYVNCTVPQGYGIEYAYLEDWYIRKENMTCVTGFQKVYDRDYVYVFKVA